MKHILLLIFTVLASGKALAEVSTETWSPLLDEKLSQFDKFIGVPDPSVKLAGYTHEANPKQDQPLGVNNDPLHVFTVQNVGGEPVLHITGEIFGVLTTKTVYENFHLRVQFRWGTTKHAPRLDKPRDNGILYRGNGPAKVWPASLECQVQENDIGDFFALGETARVASEVISKPGTPRIMRRYTPGAPLRQFGGRCARGDDYHELPNGEWNTIEVMSVGDRSIHILNGHVVNVLQDAVHKVDGKMVPLVSGQINFQSEGSEAEYRRIEISPLVSFPHEYAALFSETPTSAPIQ